MKSRPALLAECQFRDRDVRTVNGTSINSSEHFGVVYNANNVTLDVLSGPGGTPAWGGGGQLAYQYMLLPDVK